MCVKKYNIPCEPGPDKESTADSESDGRWDRNVITDDSI